MAHYWAEFKQLLHDGYLESEIFYMFEMDGIERGCCRRMLMTHESLIEKALNFDIVNHEDDQRASNVFGLCEGRDDGSSLAEAAASVLSGGTRVSTPTGGGSSSSSSKGGSGNGNGSGRKSRPPARKSAPSPSPSPSPSLATPMPGLQLQPSPTAGLMLPPPPRASPRALPAFAAAALAGATATTAAAGATAMTQGPVPVAASPAAAAAVAPIPAPMAIPAGQGELSSLLATLARPSTRSDMPGSRPLLPSFASTP